MNFIKNLIVKIIADRIVKLILLSGLTAIGIASGPAGWIVLFLMIMVKIESIKAYFRK